MSKADGARAAAKIRRPCPRCGGMYRPSIMARHVARHELPWEQVNKTETCWLWTGVVSEYGYGMTNNVDEQYAHRLFYRAAGNDIPEGWQVDHLCRTKLCVRADHLEAVTQAENVRRGMPFQTNWNRIKTHCAKGHAYTPDNIIRRPSRPAARECFICNRENTRRYRAAQKAVAA